MRQRFRILSLVFRYACILKYTKHFLYQISPNEPSFLGMWITVGYVDYSCLLLPRCPMRYKEHFLRKSITCSFILALMQTKSLMIPLYSRSFLFNNQPTMAVSSENLKMTAVCILIEVHHAKIWLNVIYFNFRFVPIAKMWVN